MRKFTFSRYALCAVLSVALLSSCKDDRYLAEEAPIIDQSFVEEFDTIQTSFNRGWRIINRSEDVGVNDWEPGSISGVLLPYSSKGTNAGFLTADYQATAGAAETISVWAVSPSTMLKNGDKIVFYTVAQLYALSATDSTDYANRLQVRINPYGDGLNVGQGDDPGQFDITLLDINPTYLEHHSSQALFNPNAYPARWTRFEATVYGLNKPVKGRFAFRYFVEGAGSNGRGSEVGLDSVAYISSK
jgi:hypothetical protein